jgi:hypothetical protein
MDQAASGGAQPALAEQGSYPNQDHGDISDLQVNVHARVFY